MTIDQARKKVIESINADYHGNEVKNIGDLLLEYVTKLSLTDRIMKKSESLSSEQERLLLESIGRLQNHEPIQYIINECWFAGMKFYVDKNVLIPRPETEELVEWVARDWQKAKGIPKAIGMQKASETAQISNIKSQIPGPKFLDIGTGSGCIAVALKTKLPGIEMWACDVSDEALNVARMNADSLHTAIDFVPLNFLDAEQRQQLPRVDIIVSNPPYVPENNKGDMKKNIVDQEPSVALFVQDDDPLIFFGSIAEFGNEKLQAGGRIYVEIHEDMGYKVQNLFRGKGYDSELKKDLQGKDRMVKAYRY